MADEEPKVNGAMWPMVIKLRKKVQGGDGEEVDELKFREPTASDIERCGDPVTIDFMSSDTPKLTYNEKSMSAMMSLLANVPPSTIRKMNTKDYENAKIMLTGPFMPDL